MKIYTIYKAECLKTGHVYVGMTGLPMRKRVNKHLSDVRRGSQSVVHTAMRTIGVELFVFHEVAKCLSWEDAIASERDIIAQEVERAKCFLLNVNPGHGGGIPTADTRSKMRSAKLGIKYSQESIEKSRAARTKKDIFHFVHPMHGEVECTMHDLMSRFGLESGNISCLCRGIHKSVRGWRIAK